MPNAQPGQSGTAQWTLNAIASACGLEFSGEDRQVKGLNTLEDAGPDDMTFLANVKYARFLATTRAGSVILSPEALALFEASGAKPSFSVLLSPNPYADFARILALFEKRQGSLNGISPLAFIHPEAVLGEGCTVYPFAYIGSGSVIGRASTIFPGSYVGDGCRVGENCLLYPNSVLMDGTVVGDGCILQPGAVLGSDGFGFTRTGGIVRKIPQNGSVIVGGNVEIGANSTVDKGVLGPTLIGDHSKLDNQVQIGHNVRIGKNAIIVAQSGVAGSTRLGDDVTLAAKAGLSGHLKVGDRATIGPISGVTRDVPEDFKGGGIPLMEEGLYLRNLALAPKLPELSKRVKNLERELEELKKLVAGSKEEK